jgi:hypothetical protein
MGTATSTTDFFVVPTAYTPSQVDFTGQISAGGSYTGTIVNGGDIGLVLFEASAGQQLSILVNRSTIASANISILGPGGTTLANTAIGVGGTALDSISAPTTGTYTILVASNGAAYTGSLTLNLSQPISPPNSSGSSTKTDQVVINTPGQTSTVFFNGTAGQLTSVLLANSIFPGDCYSVIVSILNPDGSTLTSSKMCGQGSFFVNPVALPTTGTYTVEIAPQNGGVGSASVTLSLFNEQKIPITPIAAGTTGTQLTINTPGQNAQLIFSGTAGQLASVLLSKSTFPGGCYSVIVSILNPDGSTLTSSNMCGQGSLFVNPVALPTSGNYTLVVAPQGGAIGSASVVLSLFNEQTGAITSGTPATVVINTSGQDSQLTFNGTAGQLASIQLSNSTFNGCYSVIVSILNPDGSTLTSSNMCGQSSFFVNPVALPTTGTYTVVIAPYNGGTGSVNVTLYLFYEQTSTITSGTPASVVINIPGQDAQLTFSGTAGQLASVQLSNSTFNGCYSVIVSILNPDGSTLTSSNMCGQGSLFVNPVALPTSGNYTLVVAPQGGAIGSASVALSLFNEQTGAITSGTPASVVINIPGQDAQLTFSGTAGQLASVQLSNSTFNGCWSLIVSILAPDGSNMVPGWSGYMCGQGGFTIDPITLQTSGSYTIVVAPQGGGIGRADVALTLQ